MTVDGALKPSRVIVPLGPRELLVQTAVGTWLVTPSYNIDVAIGPVRDGVIEPWTTRLIQEALSPGKTYFNAGANFGYYAALGAQIVGSSGHVFAVEPNPHILPYLMKSAYWSGVIGHVSVCNRALWHKADEKVVFHFDPQYLGGGSSRELWGVSFADTKTVTKFEDAVWDAANVSELFDARGMWIKGRGAFLPFEATTETIDRIVDGRPLDLIHLDIEGAEAFALLGARETISASPDLKLITEWAAHTYIYGSDALKAAFREVFAFLSGLGYVVRHLEPRVADDGGIYFSEPKDFEWMTTKAEHGDYYWSR